MKHFELTNILPQRRVRALSGFTLYEPYADHLL